MSLKNKILDDLKSAMKAKEADKLNVLRSLKAKLLEKEISERKGGEASLSDEQVVEVLMKAAKQRKESIDQFEEGGRDDLADKEKFELEIIEEYLPEMMDEDEIRNAVKKQIDQMGATDMSDMGKVMGALMGQLKGKAEGATISKIVKEELSK
ncbi:GatB/YqeY domain-containing protein [Rhodohalobacter sulfatireducens]|uniref:GatB/YqeY domain-containing protein n=1 Tax=Rhodohalobacter sulfatireducens TaxID=2911366 RepID=A0ABS9K8M9_9BACT|nr:GatB/YqeY domain-containing protein [Rhodohalobacter sulfatireducens]MCG2587168.1 GatB/YqeY domain-containing protein [Rhodohalobacter sulfatireducens]